MTSQEKRYPAFNDVDKMPFGKFEGELLQDVPASYLNWLYGNMDDIADTSKIIAQDISKAENLPYSRKNRLKLYNYIHNSMDAIKMELNR